MSEFNKTTQTDMSDERGAANPPVLIMKDFFRGLQKLWWLVALLTALFAGAGLLFGMSSYEPVYKAESTFTVETYTTQGGYTFYYDSNTAAQMARTFPYLLDSDLLIERVKTDLQTEYLNGVPKAEVIDNSNLFTLSVTSRDPQAAYDILLALIRNYPTVAEYVIGKTQLNMIDYPEFPTQPDNQTQYLDYAFYGSCIGLVISMALLVLYAITRNTVRQEQDIEEKLYTDCIGCVPLVIPKRSGRERQFDLSIHNSKVGASFKESFRGIALQLARRMEGKKILLLTATNEQEGTSAVAENLARELADQGKRVILLDGNFRTPKDGGTGLERYLFGEISAEQLTQQGNDGTVCTLRCSRALTDREISRCSAEMDRLFRELKQRADYILIDAPACRNLDAICDVAERAEAILYVIQQDRAKLPHIMNCFEDLNQFEAKIIGCVLNGARAGATGYGYGYGYGYGRSYRYGRYGDYGYGGKDKE